VHIVIKCGFGDPNNLADLLYSVLAILIKLERNLYLLLIKCPRPSPQTAPRPGGGQSCSGPFADEIALKLGQRSEDMKYQLPAGGSGVDGLPKMTYYSEPDAVVEVFRGALFYSATAKPFVHKECRIAFAE